MPSGLLIPTMRLSDGAVVRHDRWQRGGQFFSGTPAEVARRFLDEGQNNRLHVRMLDGPSTKNRSAISDLLGAGMVVFAEGQLRSCAACRALALIGVSAPVVEPVLVEDPEAGGLQELDCFPVLAVGTMLEGDVKQNAARARRALELGFIGLLLDPLDVEETLNFKRGAEARDAELLLRGLSFDGEPDADYAGRLFEQLQAYASLDLTWFVDGEAVVELTRKWAVVEESYPPKKEEA
jgi:hypothetical protein